MNLSRLFPSLVILAAAAMLSSCATMFHHGPAEIRISGPDSMKIMTFDSTLLGVSGHSISQVIIPPRGTDSVVLLYKGKRHTAYLEKQYNANLWLNILLYGWIGFGVDDLSQTWFDYRYMTAVRDSNDNLHVYAGSKEQTDPNDRIRFLLLGGEVVGWRNVMPATSSTFQLPGGSGYLDFEFGGGINLYNQMELFYRTRSSIESNYGYNWAPGVYQSDFSIGGTQGVAVRFIRNRFFLEGSYNWATVSGYSYDPIGYGTSNDYSKQIALAGVALGFHGDLTYFSLEYMTEMRPFIVEGTSYSTRRLTLSYGVNLRF
jgi:hypothetical protein